MKDGGGDPHRHFQQAREVDWRALAAQQTRNLSLADAYWALLGRPVGRRLADIGCGPGVLAARYAELGARVLAVDVRPDALARVPPHPRLQTLLHDIEAGPLPAAVDLLVMTDVLHHAAHPAQVLAHARASAGRILLAEHEPGQQAGPPVHARLAPARVAGLLEQAGFRPGPPATTVPGQYAIVADAA